MNNNQNCVLLPNHLISYANALHAYKEVHAVTVYVAKWFASMQAMQLQCIHAI